MFLVFVVGVGFAVNLYATCIGNAWFLVWGDTRGAHCWCATQTPVSCGVGTEKVFSNIEYISNMFSMDRKLGV
jgi:hypothetical protein